MKYRINKDAYDSLAADTKTLYTANDTGDTFTVTGIEGAVSKDVHDEFRTNNNALRKQIDELTNKFSGFDPAKYAELMAEKQTAKEKGLMDAGKHEEVMAERIKGINKAHFDEKTAWGAEKHKLTDVVEKFIIDNSIIEAAMKVGARKEALSDIVARGRSTFKMVNGTAVPMNGEHVMYGADGMTPVSMDSWMQQLVPTASHLFEGSSGGGAGKHAAGAYNGGKVMTREQFAAMPSYDQGALMRSKTVKIID